MNSVFTFADDNTDFVQLKNQGTTGVLIEATSKISEKIKKAASCEMSIWVQVSALTKEDTQKLSNHAGRISFKDGKVEYVSTKDLKHIISDIGSAIGEVEGFILPVPRFDGPIWNKDIEALCEFSMEPKEVLYDLFDEEKELSSIRSWYYTNLTRYIAENYMKPQKSLLEKLGKNAVFHIGKANMLYTLASKMINPVMLKREGYYLAAESPDGGNEMGLANGDFLLTDKTGVRIGNEDAPQKILLVKPTRGVMERYIYGTNKSIRIETPVLLAEVEGVYNSDMLTQRGYSFGVADEYSFGCGKDFSGYEHIIICQSCLFSEAEIDEIKRLKKSGVKINDRNLILDLTIKGEEEWEK